MITQKLQAELRAMFNPDGSDLRKMQLRMLEMLRYIDKICRENNIKYWLSSGTCLGAVRHGGFIPWDDDCDIEMFSADFKRLRRIILSDPQSPFIWQDHSTDSAYLAPYAKLRDPKSVLNEVTYNDKYYKFHGIYIDIFIIKPSRSRLLKKIGNLIQILGLFKLNLIKNEKIRQILIHTNWMLIHYCFFPLLNLPDQLLGSNNQYRHVMGSLFLKPRKKSTIGNTKRVLFEGSLFPIPEDPNQYLSMIYGDYNVLPDLDKVHSHISNITIE